jgi:hypothetical protein
MGPAMATVHVSLALERRYLLRLPAHLWAGHRVARHMCLRVPRRIHGYVPAQSSGPRALTVRRA